MNILLIDDDNDTQKMIRSIAEHDGHIIRTSSSGQDGLRELRSCAAPDIVLLDIYLPDLDGYQTLNAIRANYPKLPVVAITAYYTEATSNELNARGFNGFLQKPLSPTNMMSYLVGIAAL